MLPFEVTILGCGSAKPTLRHHTTAQVVKYQGSLYMIDCGEGSQVQLMRYGVHSGSLGHIFISHAHGDHCLGLPGLLSSMSLNSRKDDINIYVPADFVQMLQSQIDFFVTHPDFAIHIHPIDCSEPTLIFADQNFRVTAFPLEHRVPCYGFLFQEQAKTRHIKPESIQQYGIPYNGIAQIQAGEDFAAADGRIIPNEELTTPAVPPRSYAYLSDTLAVPQYADMLQGVDLIYHDATYDEGDELLATQYYHATSRQAAEFAQACQAGKLLLGHFSSRYNSETALLEHAVKVFPETLLADEGLTVKISG